MTVPGSTVVGDHASIPAEGLCVMSIWPALSVATQRAGDAQEIPAIQCPGSTGEMCQPAARPPGHGRPEGRRCHPRRRTVGGTDKTVPRCPPCQER